MPKPTKVRILEYLYTVSSIPRKQLKLAFQDVAYNTVFRATKELLDSGYIELLSVSKGPTRIKITKAGMDYLSKQKDALMLNEDIAKEENMTFGDAFDKALYYSRINIYDFDWFPAYDSTAQEKFETLYEHFGNPSGLYWKTTSFGGIAFNSFDELKAATYEDVGEAKSYWLVWDCDGYTLAAECYDQFDGKETPQETSVTSIYVFPDVDESYISHIDASSIVDGYVGSGSAPLCLSGIKSDE